MKYIPSPRIQSIVALKNRLPESEKAGSYFAVSAIRTGKIIDDATAIDKLTQTEDPMVSRMARDVEVLRLRSNLREYVTNAQAELETLFTKEFDSVTAASIQAAGLTPNEFAGEYRAMFRAMDASAQSQFLQTAFNANDVGALASITEAPTSLVNGNRHIIDTFRNQFLAKTSKPGVIEQLKDANGKHS